MADDVVETRRVVIEYKVEAPPAGNQDISPPPTNMDMDEIVEHVRRELIRMGSRNPDIFGGRA